jgi:teichuronic acid biosynthesis glycosyltransferase TuaG
MPENEKPLISVITPCYNSARYIAKTIESVLAQTYQNWEMIIVDDCSTDNSYQTAIAFAEKDKRIRVYRQEQNSGAALARNKAILESRGKYVAFLDSDDLWLPEKLEKQLRFMQKNNSDFSFTEYEHMIDNGGEV